MADNIPEDKSGQGVTEQIPLNKKRPKNVVSHSKEILSAVIIGVLVTSISTLLMNQYYYPESNNDKDLITENEPINAIEVQASHREYYIRANLAQVMSGLSRVKIHFVEYYMMTGKFPVNANELNLSVFDLDEYDQVVSSYLVEKGGVGVKLSSDFGEDRSLIFTATPSKNGAFLRWHCETNVDKQYLGLEKSKICEYNEEL